MSGSWKKQTLAVAFAAMLAGSLAACGGGGGGSSTTGGTTGGTSNTTTDTVTTTSGGTATSATVVNTSATGVTGTGTTGTTSTGLTMADKISVISSTSAKTTAAPKGIKLAPKGKTTAPTGTTWAATADYVTDPTFTYIADRSEEAFKSSNEILCMIAQIKADKMVNKGAYLALVDKNKCSSNRDNAKSQGESSQNQSSGASAPDYEKWTVISNRADGATDPMVVSVWVPTTMGDPSKGGGAMAVIQAKAIVAEEPSAANPYGFFYMSFAGYADANGDGVADNTTVLMSGYMRTVKLSSGEVVLQFYDSRTENIAGTDYTFADYSTVFKNGTDVGGGEVKFPNWDAIWGTGGMPDLSGGVPYKQMRMAYDASTFKRQEVDATTGNVTGTAVCLDKTKFDTSAWRYGAYKAADGSRIALSSGFPLVYSDTNGDHQGWIGFYGMWFPDVTVPNGATVTKFDYSNGSATGASYTVFKSGGKLMKHTKESLTLADIKNVPVQYGMDSGNGQWVQFEVVWDGTNLVKSKYLDQNTYYWKNCTIGTAPCTTADVSISSWDNSFNFWSQALGGDGRVELARCTGTDVSNAATDATISNCTTAGNIKGKLNADQTITPKLAGTANVIFHKTDMVYKGDTALNNKTLACFENCPNGTAIQAAVADPAQTTYSSAAYVNTSWGAWDPNNPNLSNINNQLDPSKVAQCEGLTNATPSVCQTTYINWGAPTCTANGGTSGVNNPGVDCCGDKSVTDQWGTYQQWACPSVSNSGGFYGYTFDATNYTLTDKKANKSVALTVSPTNMTDASWGFNSGLLFNSANFADTTTQYSWTNWDGTSASGNFIASIKCDWPYDMGNGSWADAGGGNWQFTPGTTTKYGTCAWRMWDTLNVFYTWETGPNDWNSFQTLTDSNGAVVTFDPPLHMSYTHTQTDSTAFDYSWNGSKMTLEYNGFGDLWGIPGTCWDMDTGSEAECGPGTRWVPAFSIPDGSTATYKDAQGNTQTAYIKALESEKRMRSSTSCTQTLTQYELPPASKYVAPDINGLPTPASNPNDPIASGAPSVIGGVVQ